MCDRLRRDKRRRCVEDVQCVGSGYVAHRHLHGVLTGRVRDRLQARRVVEDHRIAGADWYVVKKLREMSYTGTYINKA